MTTENRAWPLRTAGIAYGGDYNPEQWPVDVQLEDVELMRRPASASSASPSSPGRNWSRVKASSISVGWTRCSTGCTRRA